MKDNIQKGRIGERLAQEYLRKGQYKILESNFRNRIGEIDIIASKKGKLIFIEVKSRKSLIYGLPYEAVNYRKQRKIINTSMSYIQYKGLRDRQIRYDIIEVYLTNPPKINHIKNAFCI